MDEKNWDLKIARDCLKLFIKKLAPYGIIMQRDLMVGGSDSTYIDKLELDEIKYFCKTGYAEYLSSRMHSLSDHDGVSAMYQHMTKHINQMSENKKDEYISMLENNIKDYKHDLNELQGKIKEYDEYTTELEGWYEGNLDSIHQEIDGLRESVKTKTNENVELEINFKEVEADLENANSYIKSLKDKVLSLELAVSSLENAHEKLSTDYDFKIAILEGNLMGYEAEIDEYKEKMEEYQQFNDAMQDSIDKKNRECLDLEERVRDLQSELAYRNRRNVVLEAEIKSLEDLYKERMDEFNDNIDTQRQELVDDYCDRIDDLTHDLDVKTQECDRQAELLVELGTEIVYKNSTNTALQNEIKRLEEEYAEDISKSEFRIEVLERQLDDQSIYTDSLNEKLDDANTKIIELEDDLIILSEEINTLKKKNKRMKTELIIDEAENKDLDEENNTLRMYIDDMKLEMEKYKTENRNIKEEMKFLTDVYNEVISANEYLQDEVDPLKKQVEILMYELRKYENSYTYDDQLDKKNNDYDLPIYSESDDMDLDEDVDMERYISEDMEDDDETTEAIEIESHKIIENFIE